MGEQGHGAIQGGRIQGGRRGSEVVGNVPDVGDIEGGGPRLGARRRGTAPRKAAEVVVPDPDHDRPAATIPESRARIFESIAAAMPARTAIGRCSIVVVFVVEDDVDLTPVESVVLERQGKWWGRRGCVPEVSATAWK